MVRSTHGVNCSGSCSWKVHVKQGIVTWETQQTDYPENGADVPDYMGSGEAVHVDLPRFDIGDTEGRGVMRRSVPVRRVGGHLVTTVFDLLAAQLGVARDGLPGHWPAGLDDPEPYTPAWQEEITGVPAELVTRIAREFARNAERTNGRSMIVMGAGTNHWMHADLIYRAMLGMVLLCGCQGVNGGGWAHYVGQEKVRPITGFSQVAFALGWSRPSRHQAATPFWYLAPEQYRYEAFAADELASPTGEGTLVGAHFADLYAKAARMGWLPAYPSFDRNPLDITAAAEAEGVPAAEYAVRSSSPAARAGSRRWSARAPPRWRRSPERACWHGSSPGRTSSPPASPCW